jgi:hypothetical protein
LDLPTRPPINGQIWQEDEVTTDIVEVQPVGSAVRSDHPAAARAGALSKAQWQRLLLPAMIGTVIVATVAFLSLSLLDTQSVRRSIRLAPVLNVASDLASLNCRDATSSTSERARCLEWKVAVLFEQNTINRRYHQANVALLVRVSVKYLGFLTGMLMSLVGSVFVLGRLTEAPAQLAAEGAFGKFTIATVSPGLILAVLGTALMVTTVLVNPPTDVTDGNIYLRPPAETGGTGGS